MGRPKGSKNKNPRKPASEAVSEIDKSKAKIAALEGELAEINASIEEKKQLAIAKKKEIRKETTLLKRLEAKKEKADAKAATAAAKVEIEEKIAQLMSSGKSAEDILALLN